MPLNQTVSRTFNYACNFTKRNNRMKKGFVLSILALTMLQACRPIMLTATPTSFVAVPQIIFTEVLQNLDSCRPVAGIDTVDNTYSFSCSNSADTMYTVSMARYDNEATAYAQFEAGRGENPVTCFHGYYLYETLLKSSTEQPSRIIHQELHWQAGQWVVSISASYDYGFFHYNTIDFAEAVYTSSIEHNLFQAGTCLTTTTASP
jgi:hypothetical protein